MLIMSHFQSASNIESPSMAISLKLDVGVSQHGFRTPFGWRFYLGSPKGGWKILPPVSGVLGREPGQLDPIHGRDLREPHHRAQPLQAAAG